MASCDEGALSKPLAFLRDPHNVHEAGLLFRNLLYITRTRKSDYLLYAHVMVA